MILAEIARKKELKFQTYDTWYDSEVYLFDTPLHTYQIETTSTRYISLFRSFLN